VVTAFAKKRAGHGIADELRWRIRRLEEVDVSGSYLIKMKEQLETIEHEMKAVFAEIVHLRGLRSEYDFEYEAIVLPIWFTGGHSEDLVKKVNKYHQLTESLERTKAEISKFEKRDAEVKSLAKALKRVTQFEAALGDIQFFQSSLSGLKKGVGTSVLFNDRHRPTADFLASMYSQKHIHKIMITFNMDVAGASNERVMSFNAEIGSDSDGDTYMELNDLQYSKDIPQFTDEIRDFLNWVEIMDLRLIGEEAGDRQYDRFKATVEELYSRIDDLSRLTSVNYHLSVECFTHAD
jgi:hypothetical protein